MKRNLFVFANAAVALVFIALILGSLDLSLLVSSLSRANFLYVALAVVFYFTAHFLAGLRFKLLLPEFSLKSVFSSHMKAMLASDVTPARIGYTFFVFDMREKGLRGGAAAKAMGISLASDFIGRGILALIAVFIFSESFANLGVAVLAVSLLFLALLFYRLSFFASFLSSIPFYGSRLREAYEIVFLRETSVSQLVQSLAISLVGAIARGLQWFFVCTALGLQVGLLEMTVFSALLTALSFIPLSIAGIGLQEGGGILLFNLFLGIPAAAAAGALILVRFVDLFMDSLVGGWFFLFSSQRARKLGRASQQSKLHPPTGLR